MLQQIELYKFQLKQAYTLAPVASPRWHSQIKTGKSKEMFTTNKEDTHCKKLACPIALEYGLKDSTPCSTEWIDMCYINVSQIQGR